MQHKTWCAALVLLSSLGTASAQDLEQCQSIAPEAAGSLTAMADCIASLTNLLTEAATMNQTLAGEIETLRRQQEANRAESVQIAANIETINGIFNQAVIAFNRSERAGGACPEGWSLFDAAGGRVLVGAGEHGNNGLSEYPSFADDPADATGGSEAVRLTVAQLAPHRHGFAYLSVVPTPGFQDGGTAANVPYFDIPADRAANGAQVEYGNPPQGVLTTGDGEPHENRPPFIAVYFCTRE